MNGYERYMAMLSGKPCDRVPCIPILMRFAAEYIGSNYGKFASDHRVLVESQMACARDFGMDQLSVISDPYRETQGFGAEIIYHENSVPSCVAYPLQAQEDLDPSVLTNPDPMEAERMRDRIEGVRLFRELGKGQYSVMGWVEGPAAEASDLRGVSEFMMDLLDDPGVAGELMDLCVETGLAFAKAQIEAGADTIGIGDAVASQMSPEIYEQHILPREKRLVDGVKAMGARVRLHICGNITHLLPGLRDLDLDILDVDHMVSMEQVRTLMGPEVTLAGNLDPVAGILRGEPEEIARANRDLYDLVGNRFAINAGCEIPSGTPVENLKALCEPLPWKS